VLQENDASSVAPGLLTQPQGGPFNSASLSGSYALVWPAKCVKQEEDVVGQLSANGRGM